MNIQNPSEWRENSPRRYERELDPPEMFYASMARTWEATGHTSFGMTAAMEFTVQPTSHGNKNLSEQVATAFRIGWMSLRHDFPTIAAEVVYDSASKKCKKVYEVPENAAEVETWLKETFRIVEDKISGKDLAKADEPVGRFATLFLLPSAFESEQQPKDGSKKMSLLFRCGHDIVDGVGTLNLLNSLFRYASSALVLSDDPLKIVEYGYETYNLSLPLAIAYGTRAPPTEDQLSAYRAIQTSNKEAREGFEVIGFPTKTTTAQPKRSQLADVKFSTQETTDIIKRCKPLGVTPTHLLHTSVALALGSIQDRIEQKRKARYITYALMNLRDICEGAAGGHLHADSVLHTVSIKHLIVDLTIPAGSDNNTRPTKDEISKALYCVRDFYRGNVVDEDFISTIMTLFKAVTPPYSETLPAIPEPSPDRAVSLSSLGLIDKLISPDHGPFTISDISISAGEYSTGVGLFFGTFDGKMKLEAVYNEAYHDDSVILDFLRKVKDFALEILEHAETNDA